MSEYKCNHFLSSVLQSAVGWDYQSKLAQHESQTDAAKGFGGKYGVQKERVDEVMVPVTVLYSVSP